MSDNILIIETIEDHARIEIWYGSPTNETDRTLFSIKDQRDWPTKDLSTLTYVWDLKKKLDSLQKTGKKNALTGEDYRRMLSIIRVIGINLDTTEQIDAWDNLKPEVQFAVIELFKKEQENRSKKED